MYMVCYLNDEKAITAECEFGTLAEAREYINSLVGKTQYKRFVIKREWSPGD